MAIFHCAVKNISRSEGRSIVACAAYRSGERLRCHTYGKEQDYTKKSGIEFTAIFGPDKCDEKLKDRQTLWNEVEKSELKKDGSIKITARLAKEFEIALPFEINEQQRQSLITDICTALIDRYKVMVDAAIHAPHIGGGSDHRNYHAHILLTTRYAESNGLGKKNRNFNDNGVNETNWLREMVATKINNYLEAAGFLNRVNHLSYASQNLNLEPTIHEGVDATYAKRRDKINLDVVNKNIEITQRNKKKALLDIEIRSSKKRIYDLKKQIKELKDLENDSKNNFDIEKLEQGIHTLNDEHTHRYQEAIKIIQAYEQKKEKLLNIYSYEVEELSNKQKDPDFGKLHFDYYERLKKEKEHEYYRGMDRYLLDHPVKDAFNQAQESLYKLYEIGEDPNPQPKKKSFRQKVLSWFVQEEIEELRTLQDMIDDHHRNLAQLEIYYQEVEEIEVEREERRLAQEQIEKEERLAERRVENRRLEMEKRHEMRRSNSSELKESKVNTIDENNFEI